MSFSVNEFATQNSEVNRERIEKLEEQLKEAKALFHESVDNYPVEEKQDLWTSRVRAWLKKVE